MMPYTLADEITQGEKSYLQTRFPVLTLHLFNTLN